MMTKAKWIITPPFFLFCGGVIMKDVTSKNRNKSKIDSEFLIMACRTHIENKNELDLVTHVALTN